MSYFGEIMKWAHRYPYLTAAIALVGLTSGTMIVWKSLDSLKEFPRNGTPLVAINMFPSDSGS